MYERYIKRLLDMVISLAALLVLSPLLLALAVLIKLDSPGPVIFSQKRFGKNRTFFQIYKFRSMRADTPHDVPTADLQGANRFITPLGNVLRKTSLDELPQLWNVLRGEMSLVGPRPECPALAEEYEKTLPEFSYRLKVKAGITGMAQVYGNYATTPRDKLLMDIMYIEDYTLSLDVKLLFLTVRTLFLTEKTDGVEKETKGGADA